MKRTYTSQFTYRIRFVIVVITTLSTAITTAQSIFNFSLSNIFSEPKYYLTIFFILIILLITWVWEAEALLKEIKEGEPNIIDIKDSRIDILNGTGVDVKRYGGKSPFSQFIARSSKMYLFYIDFINRPKVAKNNPAQNVQGLIEYYDISGTKVTEMYGRWLGMPEAYEEILHRYTDIPSDGYTKKRLGIALIRDNEDMFSLLNGNIITTSSEFLISFTTLNIKEYILKVTVSGSNISNPLIIYFTLNNIGLNPALTIKKDGEQWLRRLARKNH